MSIMMPGSKGGKTATARRICSWCRRDMGTKECVIPEGFPAQTHGLCFDCQQKMEAPYRYQSLSSDIQETEEAVQVRFSCCGQSFDFSLDDRPAALEMVAEHVCED